MDVLLVPIARGRYALYCEPGEEPDGAAARPARGFWRRMTDRFSDILAAVEREHAARLEPNAPPPSGLWPRLRGRVVGWMAEKIAEQRLLWRLRGRAVVHTTIPSGLEADRALLIVRANLTAEFDRHRWWMVFDVLGGLVALALTPIPGPNMLGYYFTFRIVGHFFALRGARHGLSEVRWDFEPSEVLAGLCALDQLPADERERRVQAVADRLNLPRFARFYDRAASWRA